MGLRNTDAGVSVFKAIDWITILLYLILVTFGAVSIYAASYDFDNASLFDLNEFSGKQILWIGLSIIIGGIIMLTDYRIYKTYAYPIYIVVLLVLVVTIFIAPDTKGSHSWLKFGPVSLQPAEFGKFATALALAKLFDSYNFVLNSKISNYFRALIIIFLPIILILLQRETGSALVYISFIFVLYREGMSGLVLFSVLCAITFFVVAVKFAEPLILGIPVGEFTVFIIIMLVYSVMLFFYCKDVILARNVIYGFAGSGVIVTILSLCGVEVNGTFYFILIISAAIIYTALAMFHHRLGKYLITIGFAITSVLFLFSVNYVFGNILEPHQQMRIKVALGIEENLQGAGYNVNQSKIAIGSGGVTGKGFLNGTQTKLKYVPEQHTDFIFCTIGEEEGFVGSTVVLILYLALILRLIHIAERQRTVFERVYAYCVVSILIFHLGINVGMVIGLCPVIGIPLPFFSYGGSSLWGFTILLFILLRLDASRKERMD
ncbi:MAG: rod shape-determining protein RodA [Bacteroides sp.]|nr:rod shape-determining protein RodA [Bacteroidales bacterium]MBD5206434.1 rod shape-determining protein RodA [Bacteroidales bacterium]MBD5224261.1 rod shape-determining protein RodA [Bacteroidales bacterium]MBD5305470.1 rod shape-determining protein RodA [Bacteroides sp.]MBD5349145.1 rod shape-determining protein RodA [Bacteroides sp.]